MRVKLTPALGWRIALGCAVVLLALGFLSNMLMQKNSMITRPSPTLRAITTAETTFRRNYPGMGYAPKLSALGPPSHDRSRCSPQHACLLDSVVGCSGGSGTGWCEKSGYRYNVQSSSPQPPYEDYWVTATPIRPQPGSNNFCESEDGQIRSESAAPLKRPYTRAECLAVPVDLDGLTASS
jgi:hypothetical protein